MRPMRGIVNEAIGMRTVEKFDEVIRLARQQGFEVRFENLTGNGGGLCQFGGKNWLFIDLTQSVTEQLETIEQALFGAQNLSTTEVAEKPDLLLFSQPVSELANARLQSRERKAA